MSFLDAREHGSKPGSGGAASLQNEVQFRSAKPSLALGPCITPSACSQKNHVSFT